MNAINKENSKVFLLILLGMLSAFGPFVTDMYLPSLPAMADYFSASYGRLFFCQFANGADGADYEHDRTGAGANLFRSA